MLIDVDGLEDKVKPEIKNTRKYLELAKNSINTINIPGDFSHSRRLRNIPQSILEIDDKVSSIEKWVDTKISSFTNVESSNKGLVDNLIYSVPPYSMGGQVVKTGESTSSIVNNVETRNNGLMDRPIYSVPLYSMGGQVVKTEESIIAVDELLKATGATIANVVLGLVKGGAQLTGALIDAGAMLLAGVGSVVTGMADGISYLDHLARGETDNWKSITGEMWKGTMSFVAKDHVNSAFKSFYTNTEVGQWLDENAIGIFKSDGIATNIISGIGYVAGIVILTIATYGIGTVAVGATAATTATTTAISTAFAAAAGTGKAAGEIWGGMKEQSWEGIQEMYEKGEISEEQINTFLAIRNLSDEEWSQIKRSYVEGNMSKEEFDQIKEIREMPDDWRTLENGIKGITASVATGAWEGLQMYTGAKLTQMTFGGGKVLDSVIRVEADTLFNAMDTPFRTIIDTVATGNTLGASWEEQGGWNSLLTNIGIGLIGSIGGEAFDALKKTDMSNKIVSLYDVNDPISSASKIADYLEKTTDVMYNKVEYRECQKSIYNGLKKNLGEEKAAGIVEIIFDKIIADRGFDELNVDGIKVKIIKDIKWDNLGTDWQTVENTIRNMPQGIKDSVNEIKLIDLHSEGDIGMGMRYEISDFECAGYARFEKKEISIFKFDEEVLYHEAGHCRDYELLTSEKISDSSRWNEAMMADSEINKDKKCVTSYATQAKKAIGDNTEDFAESIALFKKDPNEFKAKYPNRYKLVDEILNTPEKLSQNVIIDRTVNLFDANDVKNSVPKMIEFLQKHKDEMNNNFFENRILSRLDI